MTTAHTQSTKVGYLRLVAPLILVAFAVSWYEFSVVYIQAANNQLVANDNLAVYVTVQQVSAYLQVLLIATYATVAVGALAFAYYLARLLRVMSRSQQVPGASAPPGASQREASSPQVQP